MGEEKGMAYLRELQKQRIAAVDTSARQVLDQVVAGEYAIRAADLHHPRSDQAPRKGAR
jgi:iron(III) transport system substrate-binding protein